MPKKIKIILQVLIVILLTSALGYYFYSDYLKTVIQKDPKTETIEKITTLKFIKEDLDEETKNEYQEDFKSAVEEFINSSETVEAFWSLIKIEQIKELAGDYDGAKQALIKAIELQPGSYLAHANLANLYFRHYQDFAKAEEHYLKAIEPLDSRVVVYYYDLHEIYRYFYKTDTTLAEDILKQGIERYPAETNLMAILAHYYKSLDRKEEAIEYYQKILEINPDSEVAKRELEGL
ncbi:tetratricopeptide repeat protein [Patescibacteria group bacterium]|nr:tetratricopeptide repeat protein [Patescibacteria group bacterium]